MDRVTKHVPFPVHCTPPLIPVELATGRCIAEGLGPILPAVTAVQPGMLFPVAAVAEDAELPLPITILRKLNQNLLPKKQQQTNCALVPLASNILKDPSFLGVSVHGTASGLSLPSRLAAARPWHRDRGSWGNRTLGVESAMGNVGVNANPKRGAWLPTKSSNVCRPACWPGLGCNVHWGEEVNIGAIMDGLVCMPQLFRARTIGVCGPDCFLGSGLGSQKRVCETHCRAMLRIQQHAPHYGSS
jgi:hypothetical protein